jgi:DNA processing protein
MTPSGATGPPAAGGVVLTPEQRIAWLRLIRSENVGPATFRSLINHFGSAQAALAALPELSRRGGAPRSPRIATREEAEAEIAALERLGGRFVGIGESLYPPWLRHADSPPPLIALRGSPKHLTSPCIAIVGARNASVAGRKLAGMLARGLGEADFVVVSGLARGIDAAAHEAALSGGTIAVFAGGLDSVYPPENTELFERILAADGCGISEMRLGWEPRARDFPRRNRIIAGLALATVVVEAAERSGSLITARLALEQNREVLAVPGSPLDPRAAGSNNLIKQGARLVTGVADIVEAVTPLLAQRPAEPPIFSAPPVDEPPPEPGDRDRDRIMEALGPTPVAVDEIIRFTGLPTRLVQVVLLELDLAGRLERHPGQRVALK